MKRKLFIVVITAVLTIIVLVTPVAAQNTARIVGIQAHLFNSETGVLSDDMLTKDAPAMGNVPSSDYASVSTFIIVKIDFGPKASAPRNARVRLVATESGSMPFAVKPIKGPKRIILDSVSRIGPVNEDGTTYVGFWLADTGCMSIFLRASLVSVKNQPFLKATLPFACYE